jgi:hypothetical protein
MNKKWEEVNPFLINNETKPTWESKKVKWFLIKRGKKYSIWRTMIKSDDDGDYLILDDKGEIKAGSKNLEMIMYKYDVLCRIDDDGAGANKRS